MGSFWIGSRVGRGNSGGGGGMVRRGWRGLLLLLLLLGVGGIFNFGVLSCWFGFGGWIGGDSVGGEVWLWFVVFSNIIWRRVVAVSDTHIRVKKICLIYV